jgi:hypothetical protein
VSAQLVDRSAEDLVTGLLLGGKGPLLRTGPLLLRELVPQTLPGCSQERHGYLQIILAISQSTIKAMSVIASIKQSLACKLE